MAGFIEEADRGQLSLLPGSLDDWVGKDNPVRVIDAFVDGLDLKKLGFETVEPLDIGRPGYHSSIHLKLYIYGYLYRVQSSRRLERECHRNLEVMWLLGRLAPDHKTIADFRKDNGAAIKKVCGQFVELCRSLGLLSKASVAIDGSKFKGVNNRDKNFTQAKVEKRRTQLEESVARYLAQLDTAKRCSIRPALIAHVGRGAPRCAGIRDEHPLLLCDGHQPLGRVLGRELQLVAACIKDDELGRRPRPV
jgi:transposase